MAIKKTMFFLLLIALPLAREAKDPVNLGELDKRILATSSNEEKNEMSNEGNGKCPQEEMKELIGAIRSHNDEIDKMLLDLSAKAESCGCCPTGWVQHGQSCYYIDTTPTPKWIDARKKCQAMGADLAIITSSDENQFLSGQLRKHNIVKRTGAWFGLRRIVADSKFYWIDGTPVEGNYQAWGRGQPDNSGGEDCGHMRGSNILGEWNDLGCSLRGWASNSYPDIICESSCEMGSSIKSS